MLDDYLTELLPVESHNVNFVGYLFYPAFVVRLRRMRADSWP